MDEGGKVGPTEPSANHRQFANTSWQMFVALKAEGFSEHQALTIIGTVIAATIQGNSENN